VTDSESTAQSNRGTGDALWPTGSEVGCGYSVRIQKILDEVNMKGNLLKVSLVALGFSALLTVSAQRAAAQGPAGAGASEAAKQTSHTPHSLNPIKWVKKDHKDSVDSNGSRSDVEKKLTPKLQAQGLLPASSTATEACSAFTALNECLAALHASHNLGLNFTCLSAAMTGVHTNADVSGCKVADGEKALPLNKAIHALNPDANAKGATKNAEQQAKEDLNSLGS
jgi:hypothetical protein